MQFALDAQSFKTPIITYIHHTMKLYQKLMAAIVVVALLTVIAAITTASTIVFYSVAYA